MFNDMAWPSGRAFRTINNLFDVDGNGDDNTPPRMLFPDRDADSRRSTTCGDGKMAVRASIDGCPVNHGSGADSLPMGIDVERAVAQEGDQRDARFLGEINGQARRRADRGEQ